MRLSPQQLLSGLFMVVIMMNSCVTNKKTTYLQEYTESAYPGEAVAPENYRIQPNDNLFIRVTTPNPQWSAMFNVVAAGATSIGYSAQSVDLLSYPVNLDGTVEIPYLGAIPVAGKTLPEAKVVLEEVLIDYVSDASITVKLVNNYVSILGEVRVPGRYLIYKEHMNIFEALSMAGDLENYSDRFKVNLLRPTPEGTDIRQLNLTDRSIVDSEYYYVMPNDVIYVEPIKGKFFGMSQFPYTVILSTVTTFLLVLNYVQ